MIWAAGKQRLEQISCGMALGCSKPYHVHLSAKYWPAKRRRFIHFFVRVMAFFFLCPFLYPLHHSGSHIWFLARGMIHSKQHVTSVEITLTWTLVAPQWQVKTMTLTYCRLLGHDLQYSWWMTCLPCHLFVFSEHFIHIAPLNYQGYFEIQLAVKEFNDFLLSSCFYPNIHQKFLFSYWWDYLGLCI